MLPPELPRNEGDYRKRYLALLNKLRGDSPRKAYWSMSPSLLFPVWWFIRTDRPRALSFYDEGDSSFKPVSLELPAYYMPQKERHDKMLRIGAPSEDILKKPLDRYFLPYLSQLIGLHIRYSPFDYVKPISELGRSLMEDEKINIPAYIERRFMMLEKLREAIDSYYKKLQASGEVPEPVLSRRYKAIQKWLAGVSPFTGYHGHDPQLIPRLHELGGYGDYLRDRIFVID